MAFDVVGETTLNHYTGFFPSDLDDVAVRLDAAARKVVTKESNEPPESVSAGDRMDEQALAMQGAHAMGEVRGDAGPRGAAFEAERAATLGEANDPAIAERSDELNRAAISAEFENSATEAWLEGLVASGTGVGHDAVLDAIDAARDDSGVWEETDYLLSSPENARRLMEAIAGLNANDSTPSDTNKAPTTHRPGRSDEE